MSWSFSYGSLSKVKDLDCMSDVFPAFGQKIIRVGFVTFVVRVATQMQT